MTDNLNPAPSHPADGSGEAMSLGPAKYELARKLKDAFTTSPTWKIFAERAAALVAASSAPGVAAGWKLVPVKPTEDMLRAMNRQIDWCRDSHGTGELDCRHPDAGTSLREDLMDAWRDGLAAAPQPPAADAGRVGMTGLEKTIADHQEYYDEFVRGLIGHEPTARPIGDAAEVVGDIEAANRSLLADIHVKLDAMISQARGGVTASASTSPVWANLIEAARAVVVEAAWANKRSPIGQCDLGISRSALDALWAALDRLTKGGDRG